MSPQKQNAALAHFAGWREAFPKSGPDHPETKRGGILLPYEWVNEITHKRSMELPDFLSDLNALHDAEVMIQQFENMMLYRDMLFKVVGLNPVVWAHQCPAPEFLKVATATAAQRSEAILRTIGKWEDE